MALSNIFREPRREITESVVGISFFAIIGMAIHFLAMWMYTHFTIEPYPRNYWGNIAAAHFIALIVLAIGWGLLLWTHSVGDDICGFLANRGLYLRPRVRK